MIYQRSSANINLQAFNGLDYFPLRLSPWSISSLGVVFTLLLGFSPRRLSLQCKEDCVEMRAIIKYVVFHWVSNVPISLVVELVARTGRHLRATPYSTSGLAHQPRPFPSRPGVFGVEGGGANLAKIKA